MAETSERSNVNDVLKRQVLEMMFTGKTLKDYGLEYLIEKHWVNEKAKCSHCNGKS